MHFDHKQLFQIARDYPWVLFTGAEISELCNIGEDQVRRVRNAPDSPFRYNKCRPEWFTNWMQTHPDNRCGMPMPSIDHQYCERCSKAVQQHLVAKSLRGKKGVKSLRSHTVRKIRVIS